MDRIVKRISTLEARANTTMVAVARKVSNTLSITLIAAIALKPPLRGSLVRLI